MRDADQRQKLYFQFTEEIFAQSHNWIMNLRTVSPEWKEKLHWEAPKKETVNIKKDLRSFSQSLKAGNIADVLTINLPGCWIMLPNGCNVFRMFATKIEDIFSVNGLQRYDYPMLVPVENFASVADVLPIKNQILYVGTDDDFLNRTPRAGLCPTGEEIIYDHWKKIVRTKQDLPIEMYRQARFYRPMTSSRNAGIFRSMENADVFEFHGCFVDLSAAKEKMKQYLDMLKVLAKNVHVPAIFGVRPLWTNQHRVSFLTLAGDTPLPISGSVQTFCLYMQGESFSQKLDISYKENGETFYTQHVTGAISRRLMLTHLMLGWNSDGTFLIHPDFCPIQCCIFYINYGRTVPDILNSVVETLKQLGIRVHLKIVEDSKKICALSRDTKLRSVPLSVFIHDKRADSEHFKVVFERSADSHFAVLQVPNFNELPIIITEEINKLGWIYNDRASMLMDNNIISCDSIDDAEVVVQRQNKVAIVPLSMSDESVLGFEKSRNGEILTFIPGDGLSKKCIVTGKMTNIRACISRRI